MPAHDVPPYDFDEFVTALERAHDEIIISVETRPNGYFRVFTRRVEVAETR